MEKKSFIIRYILINFGVILNYDTCIRNYQIISLELQDFWYDFHMCNLMVIVVRDYEVVDFGIFIRRICIFCLTFHSVDSMKDLFVYAKVKVYFKHHVFFIFERDLVWYQVVYVVYYVNVLQLAHAEINLDFLTVNLMNCAVIIDNSYDTTS